MLKRTQIIPSALKSYMDDKGYNKAKVARNSGISPEDLYMMLTNRKVMSSDDFVKVCEAMSITFKDIAPYESLRKSYEGLRNVHNMDTHHCNIWHVPTVPSNKRLHVCQKPVQILQHLIRVSSNKGGTVLDCFMGSGSTGEAAAREGRHFIGVENDPDVFAIAKKRLKNVQLSL